MPGLLSHTIENKKKKQKKPYDKETAAVCAIYLKLFEIYSSMYQDTLLEGDTELLFPTSLLFCCVQRSTHVSFHAVVHVWNKQLLITSRVPQIHLLSAVKSATLFHLI